MSNPIKTWPEPWESFEDSETGNALARELKKELSDQHILFGISVKPIAKRKDCDDVLFELLDGSHRLANVHLTWSHQPEPYANCPQTTIFRDWEYFQAEGLYYDDL